MSDLAICTIISKNYLSFARVLAKSFWRYNEGSRVFVLLVDRVEGHFNPAEEEFELITIEELKDEVPHFWKFCFQYTQLELNTAFKPYLLKYLLKKYNLKKLIYFDPDILITGSLHKLASLLDSYSILLTPHLTSPLEDDGCMPSENNILIAGVYNLGFIALSNTNKNMAFLDWWKKRVYSNCLVAVEKGLFVDQKWIDLVPCMFEGVYILKEPGYNVSYWNLHEREIQIEEENIYVNGEPLYFFHFSGYNPRRKQISIHQNRFTLKEIGAAKLLFYKYRNLLFSNGYEKSINWPYVFGYFSNGIGISNIVRRIFLELKNTDKYPNPFLAGEKDRFFQWLNEKIDRKRPAITRLFLEIYNSREDLQGMYPDVQGKGRKGFAIWILTIGKNEFKLDEEFVKPIKTSFTEKQRALIRLKMLLDPFLAYKRIEDKHCRLLRTRYPSLLKFLKFMRASIKKSLFWHKLRRIYRVSWPTPKIYGINIAGYIDSESGVGEAVRSNIRAIDAVGIKRTLTKVDTLSRQKDNTYKDFYEINPYPINLIHINADMVQHFFRQKGKKYFESKYNIGYWLWELSRFPEKWVSCFKHYDEIWTASSFCMDSISVIAPIPVIRIPLSMEIGRIKDMDRSYFGLDEGSFLFLFIFDFLSYFERKNPLAVIEAFRSAFHPKEEAWLVLKCINSDRDPEAFRKLKEVIRGLKVKMIDTYIDKEGVLALISLCDCYVSLHRSEGFGLPLAEAMYLKKPVIATGYSGNMDFMNVSNSFPVKYKLVEIEKDIGPYEKGNIWAEPDVSHAAELMRLVYENKENAQKIGEIAAEDIKVHLNPLAVGQKIQRRIEYIMQKTLGK